VTRTIYRERIPSRDPRLKRHVLHDSESWRYQPDLTGLTLQPFDWEPTADPLDQGGAGACTAGASLTDLRLGPFNVPAIAAAVATAFGGFTQAGIYSLYSAEETLDGDGPYPPNDNGSTGLTAAKVLRAKGVITGWTQTFSMEAALTAGQRQPYLNGTLWFNSMFDPTAEGIITVDPASGLAGGHEWVVISYDPVRGLVGCLNDWGRWGLNGTGKFYMPAEKYGYLLARQGDTTFFTLPSQPAPTPTPSPEPVTPAAQALAAALRYHDWVHHPHVAGNARVARAAKPWLAENGL
jgi:hypothetical protein